MPEMINAGDIVLKRWELAWAEELAGTVRASLPELAPWMPWANEAYDLDTARLFIEVSDDAWDEGTAFQYAVFTAVGELVGSCGLMTRMGPGILEIGYWIHSDHAGRGYATALAGALARVALATPGIDRAGIRHDAANSASGRVAAKAGFTEVGLVERDPEAPGESGFHVVWELARPEP
ncbi:GNAT family N-acetyltransferase [Plantactinospora siamensis]|uniref:GNAT family N-acetyltransferase n=1 Tax=Plantactinospora siamensis TaxID=555372 RepID=A0ABV6P4Z2_9ACTN